MPSLHLIFMHRGVRYALEAASVQEIVRLPELSPVANPSPGVIGAFNHRGRVVPVVDLALCFGHGRSPLRVGDVVIVIDVAAERFAIVAEDLLDAVPIGPADIEPLSEHRELLGRAAPMVSGVALRGEELAMVLDVGALLAGASTAEPAEGELPADTAWPGSAPTQADRQILHARARALAQPPQAPGDADRELFALVALEAELIGIPVPAVREFMRLGSSWPVPCCPPHILGSMNMRGDILTLVDLRPVLGLRAQRPLAEVVVIRAGGQTLGLAVGEVLDIVEAGSVVPLPLSADERELLFCRGAARSGERVFSIIDIEAMLSRRVLHVADERGHRQTGSGERVSSAGG